MKKALHYIFIAAALIFLYNIVQIVSLGMSRLNDYGFGALSGKIILFIISLVIVYFTRSKKSKQLK
jgi:hypothetical protein